VKVLEVAGSSSHLRCLHFVTMFELRRNRGRYCSQLNTGTPAAGPETIIIGRPMQNILIQPNARARQSISSAASTSDFAEPAAANARRFHETIPGYQPTSLHTLPALGTHLNLEALWLKDESQRFGLNAFKGLGASYAVARLLAERLELDPEDLNFAQLTRACSKTKV
jgi:hypothetical protein